MHFTYCTKEEVAQTSKFNALKDLAIRLGCKKFLHKLIVGRNAKYSSEHIVAELLQYLSQAS